MFPHLMKPSRSHFSLIANSIALFPSVNSISCSITSDVNKHTTSLLWNYSLGHSNFQAIQRALKHCNIPIVNKTSTLIFKACCINKSYKIHAPLSTSSYNAPFDVVHTELWELTNFPSTSGNLYYVSFVDAFTKFT